MDAENNPSVSIIVPARNEEACLSTCLESLVTQTGINFEIIVVDDDSTDRTAEIARSFCRADAPVRPAVIRTLVVAAPPLPANWTGKNNAMAAGARVAKGKWLLFTDADTVHKAGSLARAVAGAEQYGAALLSYSPEQEVRGFWERAVMPVIFAELAATYPPKQVNDPESPIAAANGQYLLISREAYDAVGGHTAIAGDLLEDVAMARLVKSSGRKIFFRYGGDSVRTRMYRSFAQLKEGWTKNLAVLFPNVGNVVAWRLMEILGIALNLAMSAFFLLLRRRSIGALFGVASVDLGLCLWPAFLALLVWGLFWVRVRKAHFSTLSNLLSIFGLPVFAYLLLTSARLQKGGQVGWKGRTYRSWPSKQLASKWSKTQGAYVLAITALTTLLFVTGVALLAYNGYLLRHR